MGSIFVMFDLIDTFAFIPGSLAMSFISKNSYLISGISNFNSSFNISFDVLLNLNS